MSFFLNTEDGYYSLTTGGVVTVILITALLVLLPALLQKKGGQDASKTKGGFSARQLTFSAAAIALGFAFSYIRIIPMPWGGSVTLCSMLFVTLIGFWYGPKAGLAAGFAYGFLQFAQDGGSYILSPLQACLDYIFAFAALGLSGLFCNKKCGLIKGYLFAIAVRGLFHPLGGYLYWMDYMPESFPKSLAAIYPIAYNYSYIFAEGLITVVILMLPPVKKAMARVENMAVQA